MFAFKGFISHGLLASNTPGVTSLVGELSAYSLTYAKEKGYYGTNLGAAYGEYDLTSFMCENDGTKLVCPGGVVDQIFRIAQFVLDKTLTSTNEIFADGLLNDLIAGFAAEAQDFQSGAIVTDGRYYAPEWLSWRSTLGAETVAADNFIRIWFSDASFRLQYDECEIVVVPPLSTLDDFFKPGGTVENLLTARDVVQTTDALQLAKGDNPETITRIYPFDYIDPLNAAHRVQSNWGVLIYGAAGDNVDKVKDALVSYILAHTAQTRDQWTVILPDVFKRTEFVFAPRWDQYGIPNRTVQAGIYSPLVDLTSGLTFYKANVPDWPAAHIDNYAGAFDHPYKCLSLLVTGGPENRDNLYRLRDVFSDYLNIPSTSLDFNRMAQATRDWALMLDDLVRTAEVATEFSSVPVGMSKTVRSGKLFVVKSYQNIHYLVLCKASVPQPV